MCEAWCWCRPNSASPIPVRVRLPRQPAYLPHASGFDREPSPREAIPAPWRYRRGPAKLARAEKWLSRCFAFADRLQTAALREATFVAGGAFKPLLSRGVITLGLESTAQKVIDVALVCQ